MSGKVWIGKCLGTLLTQRAPRHAKDAKEETR